MSDAISIAQENIIWFRQLYRLNASPDMRHLNKSEKVPSQYYVQSYNIWNYKYDDVIELKYFRVTGLLWEESTGHRWILLAKVRDAELFNFFSLCAPEDNEQSQGLQVIWDAVKFMWRHCNDNSTQNRRINSINQFKSCCTLDAYFGERIDVLIW